MSLSKNLLLHERRRFRRRNELSNECMKLGAELQETSGMLVQVNEKLIQAQLRLSGLQREVQAAEIRLADAHSIIDFIATKEELEADISVLQAKAKKMVQVDTQRDTSGTQSRRKI
eukprot:GHVT01089893.1.p1 GENE.GHVT01089893.1~~GHVT01089893.1.p1  ORF type:complete len:116 (+),score=20.64 GHVT01089893.1:954-1301(+)